MQKEVLEQLSDSDLRTAFKKHNVNGIFISLGLLGLFLFFYYVPLEINPDLKYYLFIALIVLSAGFGIWYNFRKRKFFREFKARNIRF